jgi:hypothetical protein
MADKKKEEDKNRLNSYFHRILGNVDNIKNIIQMGMITLILVF